MDHAASPAEGRNFISTAVTRDNGLPLKAPGTAGLRLKARVVTDSATHYARRRLQLIFRDAVSRETGR
jgi:hypothetical protein